MSVHQPQPSEQQQKQQGGGGGGMSSSSSSNGSKMQKLTLRTDSVTLSPPSQLRSTSRFSPPGDAYIASGSPHQKHASSSSIASSSTIASASSRTEAFFTANHEAGVRPARSSTASIHSPGQVEATPSNPSSPQQNQPHSPTAPLSHGNVARMAAATHKLSAAQPAEAAVPSDAMQLDRSSSQSSSHYAGRKDWRDFEGRSVTPLPSPGGMADERQDAADTYRFPAVQSSAAQPSVQQAAQSSSASWGSSSSSSSWSASIASRHIPSWSGTDIIDSPKTLNFFGSPARSTHPFKLVLPKESRAGLPHERQHDFRPRFPTSDQDSRAIHAPSRFPSINANHPTPGSNRKSGTAEEQTWRMQVVSDIPTSSSVSAATLMNTDMASNISESTQTTPRLVPGMHPIVPTAYVSPPSPDPGTVSADEVPPPLSSTDSKTPSSSSSSSSRRSTNSGRHTHGPSENATNSSIMPSKALHQRKDSPSPTTAQVPIQKQDFGQDVRGSDMSPLGTPKADESEDEASGRVGAYIAERSLGVGAFSRVVLARRSRSTPTSRSGSANDSLVALKMLEKEPCRQNERMRVSWVREVEVLKHIVHPNIVRFISSFSTNKHHVLVLETVEGGELFDFLANEQSDVIQREWLVRRLFGELANAVGWMHSINLVHRDIKLENIILTKQFRAAYPLSPARMPDHDTPLIKLSDFGLSRFVDPQAPHLETRCGSEEYAAPELIIGKRYDGRQTDVWAMGVVLYALLSGSLPFLTASGETTDDRSSDSSRAQSRDDARGNGVSQRQMQQTDARTRKAHLLRIAKGDLRWPAHTNDACQDVPDVADCPLQHRLITPPARLLVARLLRRDAAKRAVAWDVWDEEWMRSGSFQGREASMLGQLFVPPHDPRSAQGSAWLQSHARVQAGAPDVVRDD